MNTALSVAQIIIAVAVIILILIQQRDSDTSSFLGGGSGGGGFYQQRRGLERAFFVITIVLVVAFAGLALLNLFINKSPNLDNIEITPNASSTIPANSGEITIVPSSSSLPIDLKK
jgi:protein translocase SecG subunit